jgi:O-antigen ligase
VTANKHTLSWLNRGRQWAAVMTAFTLPISTTGTAIFVALLVVLTLATTPLTRWQLTLRVPAATLPAALFALIAISMLWSPQPFGPGGSSHYVKLLLIPVLMASTFTGRQAMQIAHGFCSACVILLALSLASLLWQSGPWGWFKGPGVPVKDNAVQSTCFAACAFGLALYAVHFSKIDNKLRAIGTGFLALLLFADIFLISLSKTGTLIAAVLATCFLMRLDGWRQRSAVAASLLLIAVIAVGSSGEAQRRVNEIDVDFQALRPNTFGSKVSTGPHELIASDTKTPVSSDSKVSTSPVGEAATPKATMSTASRIDFWRKAVEFVRDAPLIGHGAGSTKLMYASLEKRRPSPYGEAVPDPHNQFLAIAIQAGLLGGALLITMWIAHLTLFVGSNLAHALGQVIVIQNVLSSLFNSALSQVTQGTLYCLAIGLLAALIRQQKERAATAPYN